MNKEFKVVVIPIGNANWYNLYSNIIKTIPVCTNLYELERYIYNLDTMEENIESLIFPLFIPFDSITLKGNIEFNFTVSFPLYTQEDERNFRIVPMFPFWEGETIYSIASMKSLLELATYDRNFIILINDEEKEKYDKEIDFVKKLLKSYKKEFFILNDNDTYNFDDIYDLFNDSDSDDNYSF